MPAPPTSGTSLCSRRTATIRSPTTSSRSSSRRGSISSPPSGAASSRCHSVSIGPTPSTPTRSTSSSTSARSPCRRRRIGEQLAEIVARLHARRLDRSRPLWELYVIDGLPGGRVGLYSKVHFVAVDAAHGTEIMTALLDSTPDGRAEPTPPAPRSASCAHAARDADRGRPVAGPPPPAADARPAGDGSAGRQSVGDQLPSASEAYRETDAPHPWAGVADAVHRTTTATGSDDHYLSRPVHVVRGCRSTVGSHPIAASGSPPIPFADVHDIKQASGTTVHDVVMAICAGGVRRWLCARRRAADRASAGRRTRPRPGGCRRPGRPRVDDDRRPCPTNEADPRQRLASAHEAMRIAKERHDAVPANLIQDMTRYAPPAVAGLAAARLVGAIPIDEMASPPFNLTISNVPGPRHAVYCGWPPSRRQLPAVGHQRRRRPPHLARHLRRPAPPRRGDVPRCAPEPVGAGGRHRGLVPRAASSRGRRAPPHRGTDEPGGGP